MERHCLVILLYTCVCFILNMWLKWQLLHLSHWFYWVAWREA